MRLFLAYIELAIYTMMELNILDLFQMSAILMYFWTWLKITINYINAKRLESDVYHASTIILDDAMLLAVEK